MRKRPKVISIKRAGNDQDRLKQGGDTGKYLSLSSKEGGQMVIPGGRTIEHAEQETKARWNDYCQTGATMPHDAVMAWLDSWVAVESIPPGALRIEWLPGAICDLQRLKKVIFSDYAEAASRAVSAIKSSVKMLSRCEHLGIPTEDMTGDHDLIVPFEGTGYVLSTRVEGDAAFIVGIKHGKEAGFSKES
jgi:plasmid stabilization system protein ParE